MSSYAELLAPIADDLEQVEAKMLPDLQLFEPLSEAINVLLDSGGKRIRPALALLAGRLYPSTNRDKVISLAAAVEMLHSATLVHDDVIDGSLLRRGNPTLNASWSRGATVLAGDFIFARAASFAAETGNVRVMQVFAQTLMTICEGELKQLFDIRNWGQPKDAYFQRIHGKTAALFATATESGAILGGAPEQEIAALHDYGYNLGMAFQIMDDVLDFVGDQKVIGKPVGNDLRQGTVTLPVFHYLKSHPEALHIMQKMGNGSSSEEALSQLIEEIGRSPAIDATRQEAMEFLEKAKAALDPWPDSVYRRSLIGLADYVVERSL